MNRITRKLLIGLAIAAAFAIGIAGSNLFKSLRYDFVGDESVNCIERRVCVGEDAPAAFAYIDTDQYGMTSMWCDDAKQYNELIFLDDIVAGKTCPTKNYAVELRNAIARTLVQVKGGKIVKITKGPLHTLDL